VSAWRAGALPRLRLLVRVAVAATHPGGSATPRNGVLHRRLGRVRAPPCWIASGASGVGVAKLPGRMFDLLINAEVIVDDVAAAERVFVDALGFPPQRANWSSSVPGKGFTFLFARVYPSLQVSPTRVEAMAVSPLDDSADPTTTLPFLPALLAAQGRRPWKTHANELATADIGAVADRLRRQGCAFFTMPATDTNPFTRLWLGWTADELGAYQPLADGGLMLEICETGALLQGPRLFDPIGDPDEPPGAMTRVLRRSWIVDNLADTLSALDQHLDWRPATPPAMDDRLGCRRALMGFRHPRSADVELLEPVSAGPLKDSYDDFGPGAWTIRIGVNDLSAKAEDLRRRGTPFVVGDQPGSMRVLEVDTAALGIPGLFEFAETAEP
jgi:hypothetical protein